MSECRIGRSENDREHESFGSREDVEEACREPRPAAYAAQKLKKPRACDAGTAGRGAPSRRLRTPGATILAAVTALPEVSSGMQAVRLGAVGLAMSDIYGGNAMQLTFFLLADLLAGDPVLPTASAQSLWLGLLGAVLTGIFAYGLLIRSENKLGFIGRDSLLALLVYAAGVALLTAVPG